MCKSTTVYLFKFIIYKNMILIFFRGAIKYPGKTEGIFN